MKLVTFTIDGQSVTGPEGETVLNVARANDIYIPAICYLTRCSPTLACRICLVEVDGKRAYGCNAKVKEGIEVVTMTEEIARERMAIMQVYDINHPLQCGVCDKSGECELQDNTLFQQVERQEYAIPDVARPIRDWGHIKYDAGLCIVCERCVTACKDMVGDSALTTVPRGGDDVPEEYKETMPKDAFTIWKKMNKSVIGAAGKDPATLDCTACGECIAACPVGALVSSSFQYKSNAWELESIPSTCGHCSNGCHLTYEVKHTAIDNPEPSLYRVKNDFHFSSLCGAGRFGFDYHNTATKDPAAFERALAAFETADTIAFDGGITNEEALLLQMLKEERGYKLVSPAVKRYGDFLKAFATTAGTTLYSGSKKGVHEGNFVAVVGTMVKNDSPTLRFAVNNQMVINKGATVYFHPVEDPVVSSMGKKAMLPVVTTPGSEEAILWFLLDLFGDKAGLPADVKSVLEGFHESKTVTVEETVKKKVTDEEGNETEVEEKVSKEVTTDLNKLPALFGGKADLPEQIDGLLKKKDAFTLIIGEDCYTHPNWENIAKLAGLLQKHSSFEVVLVPSTTNALGISKICDLDDASGAKTIGYNVAGDFMLSGHGDQGENVLPVPAFNQQEGTIVNIDKRVVPLNAAMPFHGYSLGHIAKAMGIQLDYVAQLTEKLPASAGFQAVAFDAMKNGFTAGGDEDRGYVLSATEADASGSVTAPAAPAAVADPVYRCDPINMFNRYTAKTEEFGQSASLLVSEAFLTAKDLVDGELVEVTVNGKSARLPVELNSKVAGTIPLVGVFDQSHDLFGATDYRFAQATIQKV